MSDIQPAPGWWRASDGRWYPPEQAPGPGWSRGPDGGWQPPQPSYSPPAPQMGSPAVPAYGAAKWCGACGTPLVQTATVCPRCGTATGSPRSKGVAILLAVFLSFWAWLYTYKTDAGKFWGGLILAVIGAFTAFIVIGFFVMVGVWIWAIVDTATKSEQWYQQYPNAIRG